MPFILQSRRDVIDQYGLDDLRLSGGVQPGDRCYEYYAAMVRAWNAKPRWTTAHEVYVRMLEARTFLQDGKFIAPQEMDSIAAYELAWQVFFQLYVMPYELRKRAENGEVV